MTENSYLTIILPVIIFFAAILTNVFAGIWNNPIKNKPVKVYAIHVTPTVTALAIALLILIPGAQILIKPTENATNIVISLFVIGVSIRLYA